MWFTERNRKIKISGKEGGRRLDSTYPFIKQIFIEIFLYSDTVLGIMDIAMNKASKNLPLDVLASSGADREGDTLKSKLNPGNRGH